MTELQTVTADTPRYAYSRLSAHDAFRNLLW